MDISFPHIIPHPLKESLKTNETQIWNSPNLLLEKGKTYLINAPSGKGKSTFLNILYGIRADYNGCWKLGENVMTASSNSDWDGFRKEQISMVFQGLELFGHLSGLENIILKNSLTNYKTTTQISAMMNTLEIGHLKDQKAETLSFGQRQRVAIIRALCQPYNWLLLDEPFSHLDELNSSKAMTLITNEALAQEAGIIITSLGALNTNHSTHTLTL